MLYRALVLAMCVSQSAALKVFVSGAGGQTGQSVFRKMLARPEFSPVGVVRSEESKAALVESGVPAESVVVCDVTDADAVMSAMAGCEAVVIATSAKPAPTGEMKEGGGPVFGFPNGQPEAVDWLGQKSQIDAAAAQGPGTHVVICSSMGGTDPNHMLNSLGRETLEDGSTKGGEILKWKRKVRMRASIGRPVTTYYLLLAAYHTSHHSLRTGGGLSDRFGPTMDGGAPGWAGQRGGRRACPLSRRRRQRKRHRAVWKPGNQPPRGARPIRQSKRRGCERSVVSSEPGYLL